MFLVRETFVAKPGHARELVNMMKESLKEAPSDAVLMLDYIASYNTIVMEYKVNSLAEFEEMTEKMRADARGKPPQPYTELYQTGYRKIFKIVD